MVSSCVQSGGTVKNTSVFGFDIMLLASSVILIGIGIAFIFSSGVTSTGIIFSSEYIKQTIWAVSGLGLLFTFASFNYARFKEWSFRLYLFFIVLLILTLVVGRIVNGSKSWIGIWELGIQPSEFTKIITILYLAYFIDKAGPHIHRLSYFLISFLIILVPMGLILLQPDLGTASVFIPIFLFMMFAAGAKTEYIAFFLSTGLLLIIFSILPPYETYLAGKSIPILSLLTSRELSSTLLASLFLVFAISLGGYFYAKKKYFYWIAYGSLILLLSILGSIVFQKILKEYQIMRLIVFLNPSIDPRGAGWNIIQSVTAVGSGGLFGKGFLQGTQSHFRYIPQQSTDFIFSILSEEWGFLGSVLVFSLFFIILYRGLFIMMIAKDRFATVASAGIVGMIFFHFAVNVGMAIGIMPITGIPLFFLSYGGSSLWTVLIGIGFLMSFYIRRYRY